MKGLNCAVIRIMVVAGLMAVASAALAEAPARFNYQAKLNDGDGVPLEGAHTLYFTLFHGGTAGSAGSGSPVFAENAVVAATDGVVSHPVGTGTNTLGGTLIPAMFDFAGDIYLQVAIDTVGNVVLPRTRLDSVPFALSAGVSGGVPAGGIIAGEPGASFPGFTALSKRLQLAGEWVARADMPTSRSATAAVAMNGRIYVMGGQTQSGIQYVLTAANEEYDPGTNTWAVKEPVPTARTFHSAAAANGRIHVLGGTAVPSMDEPDVIHYSYDPLLDDWDPEANLPEARYRAAATAVGSHIYLLGGLNAAQAYQDTALDYDAASNTWGPALANLPAPQSLMTAGTVNGYATIAGGYNGQVLKTSHRYDPLANQWVKLRDMPLGTWQSAGVVVDDTLLVIGGIDANGGLQSGVYAYDATANAWMEKAAMPTQRHFGAAAAVGSRVFFFGGLALNATIQRDTHELDPGILSLHQKD